MNTSWTRLLVAVGWVVGNFFAATVSNAGILILPTQENSNVEFVLKNEQADSLPSDVLQVFVGSRDGCCDGKSPMVGNYRVDHRTVIFDPAFDFVEGQKYTVQTQEKNAADEVDLLFTEFSIPHSGHDADPAIVAIFPSGATIPENTLRFYIHFSTPMKSHVSSDFIKLLDASGTPDAAAFMRFKQELWSEDRTRLTLLMDPGRIKRGLTQNLALGPALLEGRKYSIVIEEGWPSASGAQKAPRFEKAFTVTQALRQLPDTESWNFEIPRKLTMDSLLIHFDRAFDHQLAQSSIAIVGEDGQSIAGKVTVDDQERTWHFEPLGVWTHATVRVVVDARLEDVAGNNFRELLDHSSDTEVKAIDSRMITLNLPSLSK